LHAVLHPHPHPHPHTVTLIALTRASVYRNDSTMCIVLFLPCPPWCPHLTITLGTIAIALSIQKQRHDSHNPVRCAIVSACCHALVSPPSPLMCPRPHLSIQKQRHDMQNHACHAVVSACSHPCRPFTQHIETTA